MALRRREAHVVGEIDRLRASHTDPSAFGFASLVGAVDDQRARFVVPVIWHTQALKPKVVIAVPHRTMKRSLISIEAVIGVKGDRVAVRDHDG